MVGNKFRIWIKEIQTSTIKTYKQSMNEKLVLWEDHQIEPILLAKDGERRSN